MGELLEHLFYGLAILVGGLSLVLGFVLFRRGLYGANCDSEVELAWKDTRVLFRRMAPGLSFAVMGTIICSLAIWRPHGVEERLFETETENDLAPTFVGPANVPGAPLVMAVTVEGEKILRKIQRGEPLTDEDRLFVADGLNQWDATVKAANTPSLPVAAATLSQGQPAVQGQP